MPSTGIDGDIGLEDGARAAEPLPALGLRRLTLGRLADGHHGIDVDIGKRNTHSLERGTATILAVTSADPAEGSDGGALGHTAQGKDKLRICRTCGHGVLLNGNPGRVQPG